MHNYANTNLENLFRSAKMSRFNVIRNDEQECAPSTPSCSPRQMAQQPQQQRRYAEQAQQPQLRAAQNPQQQRGYAEQAQQQSSQQPQLQAALNRARRNGATLHVLMDLIQERRNANPEQSYTALLNSKGTVGVAEAVVSEAAQFALAANSNETTRPALVSEAADVLYTTFLALNQRGVSLDEVCNELMQRMQESGYQEEVIQALQEQESNTQALIEALSNRKPEAHSQPRPRLAQQQAQAQQWQADEEEEEEYEQERAQATRSRAAKAAPAARKRAPAAKAAPAARKRKS